MYIYIYLHIIYIYAKYGQVDHLVKWDDKMITSLQIMNIYQRNPVHGINFIGLI